MLHLPGPDFVERIHLNSDRPVPVLGRLQSMFDHGRLAGTGYVSILPVDQGIEHSAGASFAPNPMYFDPENIVKLAVEGGCNAVASTLGVLGMCARKYAHRIPFILKFNHNEFISYPNSYDQIRFGTVRCTRRPVSSSTWTRVIPASRAWPSLTNDSDPPAQSGRSYWEIWYPFGRSG